jgi:hypothetical protein
VKPSVANCCNNRSECKIITNQNHVPFALLLSKNTVVVARHYTLPPPRPLSILLQQRAEGPLTNALPVRQSAGLA